MLHRSIVGAALLPLATLSVACFAAEMTFDLATARLTLDERGQVTSLRFADGTVWPGSEQPAFWLETDQGRRLPEAVRRTADGLAIDFAGGARAEFRVEIVRGAAVFRLQRLASREEIKRFHLLCLPLPPDAVVDGISNAGHLDDRVAGVMGAEPNVHALGGPSGGSQGDRAGCRHQFVQVRQGAQAGGACARFSATADAKPGGWSMRGKRFPKPLDLSGCKALRAWVHGDGQGQLLKFQLGDGSGGARDAYLKIDFHGWRQVTIADKPYDKLHYDDVNRLSFYFNSLPAGKTVDCLIDQVEALLDRDGREQVVLLEDFESPSASLWSSGGRTLGVETLERYGLEPAAFGLLAAPQSEWLATVERFEKAAGLPSPRPGGVWNKISPWTRRSYFFLTNFKESQFDEALAIAQRGGFHTILLGQESWCQSTGHYEINRKRFPDGLPGLKRNLDRFKAAGFRVGLHFLGPSIYPPDPYLTPTPDPRLVKDVAATLAADIDAKADQLATAAAPAEFPAEDGGYEGPGSVLQVGNELIWYAARSMQPPYGFAGCRRGFLGTQAAVHAKGEKVVHLLKSYGYFLFDMDTTLLDEAAANFARVANACNIDMIYFDGSERLQGEHWYYNARLHKAFYDKLQNKNMLLQASSFSHYSWHILARTASADGHGDLKGYLEERSGWFPTLARNGLPLDIGWYYGYDPLTPLDMYEYVLGATIGYNSSMSFQVSPDAAHKHPLTPAILDLIARYEKLRISGRVPEEMRARLRIDPILAGKKEPEARDKLLDQRRDYRLLSVGGKDVFQRVVYGPWREITSGAAAQKSWPVTIRADAGGGLSQFSRSENGTVPLRGTRVGVQIHAQSGPWLAPGPAYYASDALALETFDNLAPYAHKPKANEVALIGPGEGGSTFAGVTQRLERADGEAREGKHFAVYTAQCSLPGPGGWSSIGRRFQPPLDISWHRGLGFWLRGDGQGGQFKLQLRDRTGAVDYYIANNFVGWRYQQLARPERDPIDYRKLEFLALYYNGLPKRTTVSCGVDDIKALRTLDKQELVDPWVEIGGQRWEWQGVLTEGQYLMFWPDEPLVRFGPGREPELGPGRVPVVVLPVGEHAMRFGCKGPLRTPLRIRATLQPAERWVMP